MSWCAAAAHGEKGVQSFHPYLLRQVLHHVVGDEKRGAYRLAGAVGQRRHLRWHTVAHVIGGVAVKPYLMRVRLGLGGSP